MATVPHRGSNRLVIIISSLILGTILGVTVYMTLFNVKKTRGQLMIAEVAQLAQIFQKINQDATIIGFDHVRNPINFLNVKSFVGSKVGPMNLAHPDKWKGPYLTEDLTIQTKEYEIVKTDKGYFIVPGEGVTLPNGKVVGKDFVLDEKADIAGMALEGGLLNFEKKPIAVQINLSTENPTELAVEAEEE